MKRSRVRGSRRVLDVDVVAELGEAVDEPAGEPLVVPAVEVVGPATLDRGPGGLDQARLHQRLPRRTRSHPAADRGRPRAARRNGASCSRGAGLQRADRPIAGVDLGEVQRAIGRIVQRCHRHAPQKSVPVSVGESEVPAVG